MIREIVFLLAVSGLLISCKDPISNPPKPEKIQWAYNYNVAFDKIELKVSQDYYAENSYPHHYPLIATGWIGTSFTPVYYLPATVNLTSTITVTTTVDPSYYDVQNDVMSHTNIYDYHAFANSNGIWERGFNIWCAMNRKLTMQEIDVVILSGPYEKSNYERGNLYWFWTARYPNSEARLHGNIVTVSSFKSMSAFRKIWQYPFDEYMYVAGQIQSYTFQMLDGVKLKVLGKI
ncbi:MAG: hypothetical protein LBT04_07295 [Prevotellaceae bacterium]|jgi:hypothetical protein|nr:hypothetical protein [Prevotellaceae bacterium]